MGGGVPERDDRETLARAWRELDRPSQRAVWQAVRGGEAAADPRHARFVVWLARSVQNTSIVQGVVGPIAGLVFVLLLAREVHPAPFSLPWFAVVAVGLWGLVQPLRARRRFRRAVAAEQRNATREE